MNQRHAGAALIGLLLLSGCSDLQEILGQEDSVDYKSTVRGTPLSIPPDLTQAASDPRYRAPASGSTTFSQYQQQGQQAATEAGGQAQASVLPEQSGMRVERDGDLRWLSIDQPPEAVFPKIVDFWAEQGFTVRTNDPKAGLVETDWAENRAKIPESWIRTALGSILDSVWDSGERERFRTRLERVGNTTEIYISHEQMVEKRAGYDDGHVQWEHGKEDPGLNAAMLARMLVFLGTDVNRASTMVAQAEQDPRKPQIAEISSDGAALSVAESFDRAWRRVGLALDSGGFTVDDRDRSAGDYFVRYRDTDTGQQNEEPGFFSRLFGGGSGRAQAPQYRLHLAQDSTGAQTQVVVLDANGQRDNSATARRLLSVLADKM